MLFIVVPSHVAVDLADILAVVGGGGGGGVAGVGGGGVFCLFASVTTFYLMVRMCMRCFG